MAASNPKDLGMVALLSELRHPQAPLEAAIQNILSIPNIMIHGRPKKDLLVAVTASAKSVRFISLSSARNFAV